MSGQGGAEPRYAYGDPEHEQGVIPLPRWIYSLRLDRGIVKLLVPNLAVVQFRDYGFRLCDRFIFLDLGCEVPGLDHDTATCRDQETLGRLQEADLRVKRSCNIELDRFDLSTVSKDA